MRELMLYSKTLTELKTLEENIQNILTGLWWEW